MGKNIHRVECCYGTKLVLDKTTSAETGSTKTCTTAACTLGALVPVITDPPILSVCTIDIMELDAHGFMDCSTGEGNIHLPMYSDVYIVGDILPERCDGNSGNNMGRLCRNDSDCAPGACLQDSPDHCDSDSGAKEGFLCYDDSTCAPGTCIDADHWEPCPICNPVTNKCNGGHSGEPAGSR